MKQFSVSTLRAIFVAVFLAGAVLPGPVVAQDVFSTSTQPEAAPAAGSKGDCAQSYSAAQKQIVVARIRLDANYKKEKIGCNGKSGCIRAAQKKYSEAQRDIAKQQVDASAENDICRVQAATGAPSGPPGSPGNPLKGYVSNAPEPPPASQPHTPLYYLNNALNDAVSRIPGGEQGLQQAGQAATQVDRTINQGLNDASRKTEAARQAAAEEFIKKWTHQMSPQEAVGEVAGAWAGNAAGTGLGAGAGSLLKGGLANGMTKGGIAKAGSAALKAATEEAAVTAGAGSAVGRGLGGSAPHGEPENIPPENTPPKNTHTSAALQEDAEQIAREFAREFESGPSAQYGSNSGAPACFAKNDCFHRALGQSRLWATEEPYIIKGVQDLGKPDLAMTSNEIKEILKNQFGGQAAASNPAFTAAERLAQQQGIPVPVSPSRLKAIIDSGRNGNQWLIFTKPPLGMGHVFNGRFANNVGELLDVQQQMDGKLWLSMTENTFFMYQLY